MWRAARAIAVSAVVVGMMTAAPANARTTSKTLTLSWGPRTTSCSPPVDTGVVRCYPQAFGSVGIDDTIIDTYSSGDPLNQDATAQATDQATETLATAVSSVTYTWTFVVGNTSDSAGGDITTSVYEPSGLADNRAALVVTATHDSCSACAVTAQRVLLDNEWAGDHTYFTRGSTITLTETLMNTAGGTVPPGTITLTGGISSSTHWVAGTTWSGTSTLNAPITIKSVVASV